MQQRDKAEKRKQSNSPAKEKLAFGPAAKDYRPSLQQTDSPPRRSKPKKAGSDLPQAGSRSPQQTDSPPRRSKPKKVKSESAIPQVRA